MLPTELGGRLDRLSASMTMPNRPSPAGHLSRQTSWSKDDTGLDVKRRASTLRPAVPSAEDPVTGQPCLDFELRWVCQLQHKHKPDCIC